VTLAPGAAAFSAPRDAIDEPVAQILPAAARLPSGEWAIAWVSAPGGKQIVRASPIGPGAELRGPSDIGDAREVHALRIASSGSGIDLVWNEPDALHLASVACRAK
jgi:hypothetical protein